MVTVELDKNDLEILLALTGCFRQSDNVKYRIWKVSRTEEKLIKAFGGLMENQNVTN